MRASDSVSGCPAPVAAPDPAVRRWVQRSLATDPPRARSLLVTVWGDSLLPHGGTAWLAGLIRLMAPFGINDRLVRTGVFRLTRDGWLAGESRGRASRYRLTADGARRFHEAHARIYERPTDDWHGEWDIVLADAVPASARANLRDELAWAGFGTLGPTTFLRPHEDARLLPSLLANPGPAARAVAVRARALPSARAPEDVVGTAWDVAALASDYRRFLARFGTVIERFRSHGAADPEQCFVVRTLLIHAYRRVLLRDPLLPPALLPLDWPGAAAHALCGDFYRLTRQAAERHLTATLGSATAPFPPADLAFDTRFGSRD